MTKQEKILVKSVFGELLNRPYDEINSFLGSITIQEMQKLYGKLKYEDYCTRHGIRYEDMTDEDYEDAYLEEIED